MFKYLFITTFILINIYSQQDWNSNNTIVFMHMEWLLLACIRGLVWVYVELSPCHTTYKKNIYKKITCSQKNIFKNQTYKRYKH
jgi:hypothetical protein